MTGVYAIPPFRTTTDEIEDWIEKLKNFILAMHGSQCGEDRKLAILKTVIGDEAALAIRNFQAGEKDTFEHLVAKLIAYYKPALQTSTYRHEFYNQYQEEQEPVEDFINRLLDLASKCGFRILCKPAEGTNLAVYHDLTNEFVRDRLMVGLRNENTRARLMREKDISLETAAEIARTAEAAKKQLQQTARNQSVHGVQQYKKGSQTNWEKRFKDDKKDANANRGSGSDRVETQCKYCGGKHEKRNCPAYGKTCRKCGKKNHFEKVCRANNISEIERQHETYYYETEPATLMDNQLNIGEIRVEMSSQEKCEIDGLTRECNLKVEALTHCDWYECLKLNDKVLHTVKVDSGAQANVIAKSTLKSILPDVNYCPTNVTLSAYGGYSLPVVGSVKIKCNSENDLKNYSLCEFIVVDANVKTVLGLNSSITMKFIKVPSEKLISTFQKVEARNEKTGPSDIQANSTIPSGGKTKEDLTKLVSEFKDVFDNTEVGCIKNYEYEIKLSADSVPKVSKTRPTPFSKKDKIEKELDRMVKLDVIEPVEEPTDWVNTYVAVEKEDKTRICLDPNALNKYVQREHMHLPTVDDIYSEIRNGKFYSKIDLKDGYWQIPLTRSSSLLTTFQTHIGRFKFKRLPFGLNSANEVFQKRVSQVFGGIKGVKVMYDDVLIFGSTEEEHNERLRTALGRARKNGVKLNKNKCKFLLSEVTYVGHVISSQGIKVDPNKVADILNMPNPVDKKGVQRLLGTLNFFSRYIPNMSTITHPLRELLGKNVPFNWSTTHDNAITQIKQILTSAPVLGYYDVTQPVTLETDASSHGLGAVILQDNKPIAYASRSLTPAQLNYAQIEKELLAIVFGCERFRQFLYGKEVQTHTDHKPLINVMNKPLLENPTRIQRLLLRLQCYNLKLQYVPGKDLHVPDMLSRACSVTSKPSVSEKLLTDEADYQIHMVIQNLKCSDSMHLKLKNETVNDLELAQVINYIKDGWPNYITDCPDYVKLYWPHRADLCLYDGYVLYHDRIVIPKALRAEILARIHTGHQGRERCKRLARSAVFWPRINRDIDDIVDKCAECLQQRNSPPRDLLKPHTVPDRAWQKVGIDIFSFAGKRFQIIVDYFSKWVETEQIPINASTYHVLEHLHETFTRFGFPEKIMSDGDPVYTSSKFKQYCMRYEIDHDYSSARYAQSNGQVERSLQHVKNILAKCVQDGTDYKLALLIYRTTPLDCLKSPAGMLCNRKLRTNMPCVNLQTDSDIENKKKLELRQSKSESCYNRHVRKDVRQCFNPGDLVKYKNSTDKRDWLPGQVVRVRNQDRSYVIQNSCGNLINRNRRLMLRDNASKELQYNIQLPENQVTTPSTNTVPAQVQNPAFVPCPRIESDPQAPPAVPPLRRSERTHRKTKFYGDPVHH